MTEQEIVQQSLIAMIESPIYDETIIAKYFSASYVQDVDGKTLYYPTFCKHIKTLKEITDKRKLTINHIISQDNLVFTNHTVEIINKENKYSKIKVIAMFKIENHKIIYCDELTFLMEGNEENKNIGSIS
ncbi:MAG: hypothetical protein LBE34_15510 [Flavobacteriaceae bacterium]|jgi:hypothetical protein|nr:hypothetical protein [Flavobacteriaceae bacterium]